MKKIEHRAVLCLLLAAVMVLGLVLFTGRFVVRGDQWASFPGNRHLYNSQGQLAAGRVLDRDGDALTWVDESGKRLWYDGEVVRKATLHVVGDPNGFIGAGALTAFADEISGYDLLTGAGVNGGAGNDLYLTIDAHLNYLAYRALNGKKGAVGVYNYKTGEILCMVSAPTFDPLQPPKIEEGDSRWEGVYLNRFLSGTFVPGSVFKTLTLTAALENLPDLEQRHWTCTGSTAVGGGTVTCQKAHGEMDIADALASSCNGVFGQLAAELGTDTLKRYADKAGFTSSWSVDGIPTAPGRFRPDGSGDEALAWAGVGQGDDRMNPCALMVYMGAVANGGKAAVPRLILRTESASGLSLPRGRAKSTGELVEAATAERIADMMEGNVKKTYGVERFPKGLCAKSGTAEVGKGMAPNAWFTGFLRDEAHPYAFAVVVEEGGSGADAAGNVAAQVLNELVGG